MSTYKNTNNCLLFFSAKFFLEAINTIFQFRFVETKDNKWVLEFHSLNDLIWQRKPISICLTANYIDIDSSNNYKIVNDDNNVEEDEHLLKAYYTLHSLLVESINKQDLLLPQHCVSKSDLKIFPPYHFDVNKFSAWKRSPGQVTLRISNGSLKNNYANIYLAFNNWKYIQLAKRETSNRKRKSELETVPETVPTEIVSEECGFIEMKTEN